MFSYNRSQRIILRQYFKELLTYSGKNPNLTFQKGNIIFDEFKQDRNCYYEERKKKRTVKYGTPEISLKIRGIENLTSSRFKNIVP